MKENINPLLAFLQEDNDALFERMLEDLTDEELSKFLEENPDFFAIS